MLRRHLKSALSLGLCVTSGCSFTFIETVPDNPTQLRYFDCTSTPGLPVADGVSALSNTVSAVMVLSKSKEEFEDENDGGSRDLVAGVSIGVAVIAAASGIYGLIQTERCRAAKSELADRLLAPEREQHKLAPTPPAARSLAPPASPEQPAAPQSPEASPAAPATATPLTPPVPTLIEVAPETAAPPATPPQPPAAAPPPPAAPAPPKAGAAGAPAAPR